MGTAGHAADLQMIVPAIARTLEQFPSAEFETFGTIQMPAELGRFGARVRHIPRCSDYRSFLLRLAELRWQLGLAPLRDTPFNRCKADTKWVEYTAAGIPVLASRIPVYDKLEEAGALAATSEHGWHDALERLGRDGALRRQLLIQAQKRQQELYSLGHLEEQLRTIFSRIGVALPRT
jgi:glycosyltransferase involved in cell wall biosynthesis